MKRIKIKSNNAEIDRRGSCMRIWLGGMECAVALLLIGNMGCLACGSWGSITPTDNPGLPNPNYGTDWGYNWNWGWSLQGADGSYSGNAYAEHTIMGGNDDRSTGVHTASGWQQLTVGKWISGGPGHHTAPNDAKVTGQGDGIVEGSVHMDANNASLSSGSCAAYAHAEITFSGVASGTCNINLDPTYKEGDAVIGGTIGTDGEKGKKSFTINVPWGNDTADATAVNSCSVTKSWSGNIADELEKGFGTCSVMARVNHGAYETTANASTSIQTCKLTIDYGGSGGPCGPELCPFKHDH